MKTMYIIANTLVLLSTAFFVIMLLCTKDIKYVNWLLGCAVCILVFSIDDSSKSKLHYKTIYDENPWGRDD